MIAATDPAMVVVTCVAGGESAGCLVGFHSQCGIDPVRYVVWISRVNHTFGVAMVADELVVHLLDADDHDLAAMFGGLTGDEVDKSAMADAIDAMAGPRIVGRRVAVLDVEGLDHVGVVLEPVATHGDAPQQPHPLRLSDVGDIEPGHPA